MRRSFYFVILLLIVFMSVNAQGQYTAADVHSHNDYTRPQPFYHAFNAGAGAIEADVYLRGSSLVVSHDTPAVNHCLTLQKMYLEPILKELKNRPRPLNLIIDFKEDYHPILEQLMKELAPLKSLIKDIHNQNPLRIIITGNRPPPSRYKQYPSYITFDDDLQMPHTPVQWSRVAQVSLNFENYSKWQGVGPLPAVDEKVLKSVINAVHIAGKKIRFWAAPDNPTGWQKLMELHADILCTDKIDELTGQLKLSK